MATEVKLILVDLECPDAPLHGEPPSGTSISAEVRKILVAGCAVHGMTIQRIVGDGLLSYSIADDVYELVE